MCYEITYFSRVITVKPAQRRDVSLDDTQTTHIVFLEILSVKGNALLTTVDPRQESPFIPEIAPCTT